MKIKFKVGDLVVSSKREPVFILQGQSVPDFFLIPKIVGMIVEVSQNSMFTTYQVLMDDRCFICHPDNLKHVSESDE